MTRMCTALSIYDVISIALIGVVKHINMIDPFANAYRLHRSSNARLTYGMSVNASVAISFTPRSR
jgi:hypothetical protein